MVSQPVTLQSLSLFNDLTEPDIKSLETIVQRREYQPHERILVEGEIVHSLYVICDGVVHVKRKAPTRTLLLGRLEAGDFFGEVNLFDEGLATASVDALQHSHLAQIHFRDLRQFMASNPAAGYKILQKIATELAHRLRSADSRLVLSVYWRNLKPE
jgi:CRP-like cAMP-binding protein